MFLNSEQENFSLFKVHLKYKLDYNFIPYYPNKYYNFI